MDEQQDNQQGASEQPIVPEVESPTDAVAAVPTPAQEVPTPEPVVEAPISAPVTPTEQATGGIEAEYNSNPFVIAAKGLGVALVSNPIPALLIGFLPIATIFILFALGTTVALLLGVIGSFIFMLAAFVLVIVVAIRAAAGIVVTLLASNRGEKVATKDAIGKLASGRLTAFFFASFLTGLFIMLGFIAFIIPGIILLGRLVLAPTIAYAEELGPMESVKRSFKLTKGHTFEVLSILIAQSVITFNGFLAVVGSQAGLVKKYTELAAAEKVGTTHKTHWLNFLLPVSAFVIGGLYILMIIVAASGTPTSSDYNFDFDSYDFETNLEYDYGIDSDYEVNYPQ